ncbi:hypothetical protein [Maritalea porphyrae]|nr:hypothetical protein [Maritalea porphyrae]
MTHLKKFIDRLNAGQFTLLAFIALVFIFAFGVYVGKSGVILSRLFLS